MLNSKLLGLYLLLGIFGITSSCFAISGSTWFREDITKNIEFAIPFAEFLQEAGKQEGERQDPNDIENKVVYSDKVITDIGQELKPAIEFVISEIFRNHGIDPNTPRDELGRLGEQVLIPFQNILDNTDHLRELVENGQVRTKSIIESVGDEYGKATIITRTLTLGDDVITLTWMPYWEEQGTSYWSDNLYSVEVTKPSIREENPEDSLTTGIVFNRKFESWIDDSIKTGSITYYYTDYEEGVLDQYEKGSLEPFSWDFWHEKDISLFIRDPRWLFGVWED